MHVLEHVVGVGRFHFNTGIQEIVATIFGFFFFFLNNIIEMIKNFIFFWFIDLFSSLPSVRFPIIILLHDYLYFPDSSSSSLYVEGDSLQMLFCYFDAYVKSGRVCLLLRYLLSPICFLLSRQLQTMILCVINIQVFQILWLVQASLVGMLFEKITSRILLLLFVVFVRKSFKLKVCAFIKYCY